MAEKKFEYFPVIYCYIYNILYVSEYQSLPSLPPDELHLYWTLGPQHNIHKEDNILEFCHRLNGVVHQHIRHTGLHLQHCVLLSNAVPHT